MKLSIKKQIFYKSVAMVLVFSLSGCSALFDKHIEYGHVKPDSYPILKAVGYAPIAIQPGETESQRMIMAIKVSKLEAYRELAEQVYGQNITAGMTIKGIVAQNDGMKSRVSGIIRGAKVVKSYAVGDSYATELELNMKKVYDLYLIEAKPRKVKKVTYY